MARATVVEAYEQLLSEGYLETRSGSGTRVAAELPESLLTSPPHRNGRRSRRARGRSASRRGPSAPASSTGRIFRMTNGAGCSAASGATRR